MVERALYSQTRFVFVIIVTISSFGTVIIITKIKSENEKKAQRNNEACICNVDSQLNNKNT